MFLRLLQHPGFCRRRFAAKIALFSALGNAKVLNGIFYVLSTGCQWGALPKDLPPKSPVYDYFDLWGWDGTLERLHHTLYVACREQVGKQASPTAAIIDSQSARAAQKGGPQSIRRVTMRARRSPAASGTSWSTPSD